MELAAIAFLLCAACVATLAMLIAFGARKPPAPLGTAASFLEGMDLDGLPPVQRYAARDDAELAYRFYPAPQTARAAVLIHGSTGSSLDLHPLAKALQAAGVTAYVPDLRGHGANQPHGDLDYTGQLEDDLADLLFHAKTQHRGAQWLLVGFSLGGGFAIRVAAGALRNQFNRYILLAPFLRHNAPTMRKLEAEPDTWSTTSTGRIAGLMILNRIGVHRFDGLRVVHFAVPPNTESFTGSYSWRMQKSFQPHDDYMADIRAATRPMQVLIGAEDSVFLPEEFQRVFSTAGKDVPVRILPGLGHSELVTSPQGIQAVVAACLGESK